MFKGPESLLVGPKSYKYGKKKLTSFETYHTDIKGISSLQTSTFTY